MIDYSPREKHLLRKQSFQGTAWETNEVPPRKVTLKGTAMVDPDVYVMQIEGEDKSRWLMACGSTYDGQIVGTDIWIREAIREEVL